jgi:hypothetical protein
MTDEFTKERNELLSCIAWMAVQCGMVGEDNAIDNMCLSAYESAEAILIEHGLAYEVVWQECSILTSKNKKNQMPGTYLDIDKVIALNKI